MQRIRRTTGRPPRVRAVAKLKISADVSYFREATCDVRSVLQLVSPSCKTEVDLKNDRHAGACLYGVGVASPAAGSGKCSPMATTATKTCLATISARMAGNIPSVMNQHVIAMVTTVTRICHSRKWSRRKFSSNRANAASGGGG